MRVEFLAINTVLAAFESQDWIGIFTHSPSSLQAIRQHNTNPGTNNAMHYHHNLRIFESIMDLLDTRRVMGRSTTLHKIRAHTNIRGNDLADAAVKLAVKDFDSLPTARQSHQLSH